MRGPISIVLALTVGVMIGLMPPGGFPEPWHQLLVVGAFICWLGALILAFDNPIRGWQPRRDPDGKVYAWVRPIECDIDWHTKIGRFKWDKQEALRNATSVRTEDAGAKHGGSSP